MRDIKVQNFYWDGTRESLSWLGAQAYVWWNHTPFQVLVFCGLITGYGIFALRAVDHAIAMLASGKKPFQWLRYLLLLYICFAIGVIISAVIDYAFFDYAFQPFYIYPLYVGMALLTYTLGLLGFLHRNDPDRKGALVEIEGLIDVEQKVAELKGVMTSQSLYKNPQLSLNELAEAISVKPYVLTQMLNKVVGSSFNDFVNTYRVEEVKRLMADPTMAHYTLTAIAYEAGFNSKATFNRIFRKITGKTPGQVKAEIHKV